MRLIESRNNKIIKEAVKLLKSTKERREKSACIVEGLRLCNDVALSKIHIKQFFFTKKAEEQLKNEVNIISSIAAENFLVSDAIMTAISDTSTPQGLVCICELPKGLSIDQINISGSYICCENISDPGNLGTILRTAEALGLSGAILSKDCCDVFSPKVIRGSMGSVFRLPLFFSDNLTVTFTLLNKQGMKTYGAVLSHQATPALNINFKSGSIIAIGNEAKGLSQSLIDSCTEQITLPMKGKAESLNAAIAAGILMWELTRHL